MTEQVPPTDLEDESAEHATTHDVGPHQAEAAVEPPRSEGSHRPDESAPRTGVPTVDAVLDDLEWHDFGDWKSWPGQWGNSTGPGRSPQSPACQGARWNAPAQYHSFAAGSVVS